MNDDFCQSPHDGWRMDSFGVPQLRGGVSGMAPATCLRFVAKASTAHEVPDGEPKQAGTSPDVRMMRAAIK